MEKIAVVKGIYRIPKIRHLFFILDSVSLSLDDDMFFTRMIDKEYFEEIMHGKFHGIVEEKNCWTVKTIFEQDFLSCIKNQGNITSLLAISCYDVSLLALNNTCDNPENIEMDCLNARVDFVAIDDVMEIFI